MDDDASRYHQSAHNIDDALADSHITAEVSDSVLGDWAELTETGVLVEEHDVVDYASSDGEVPMTDASLKQSALVYETPQRIASKDSNVASVEKRTRRVSDCSAKREIYLDEDGNVVYGEEEATSENDDESHGLLEATHPSLADDTSSRQRYLQDETDADGQGSSLAELSSRQPEPALTVDTCNEFVAVSKKPCQRRTKPRKHLSLADQLACLPGAPTGRYLDQSADYANIIGDDTATFIISRSVDEPPPIFGRSSSSLVSGSRHSVASASGLSASAMSKEDSASLAGLSISNDGSSDHILAASDAVAAAAIPLEPTTDASSDDMPTLPPVAQQHTHHSSQFQAVVLSFLANEGRVSAPHATRVLSESMNLVPEDGDIFLFDYAGHIVQQIPDWLVVQLGLTKVDSEASRFHMNETKKIMWRLGHSTASGKVVQGWVGKARAKIKLSVV